MEAPIGSVLLMDNIQFHHSKETQHVIECKGWNTLYTTPYSPMLNPIEMFFGAVKPAFRKRCPLEFDGTFDYRQAFITTMHDIASSGTSNYFMSVAKCVRNVLEHILINPAFKFIGYNVFEKKRLKDIKHDVEY